MKNRFLIPVLAMFLAIGMSFATETTEVFQAKDYIHLGGSNWQQIDELNCGNGPRTCQVQLGENGTVYDVYDQMDLTTKRKTDRTIPFVINP